MLFRSAIILAVIWYLGHLVPSLAVTVRRLHDTGKSGWFYLLALIPYIGGLIIFIFSVFHGQTARVKLYTGEVHHGSITSNDDFYSIQTVRGTYRIPHQKIQQVKAGRGEWIGLGEYIELREDPSFSSEKILRIFQGTTLRQTGKFENGFREVKVFGRRG